MTRGSGSRKNRRPVDDWPGDSVIAVDGAIRGFGGRRRKKFGWLPNVLITKVCGPQRPRHQPWRFGWDGHQEGLIRAREAQASHQLPGRHPTARRPGPVLNVDDRARRARLSSKESDPFVSSAIWTLQRDAECIHATDRPGGGRRFGRRRHCLNRCPRPTQWRRR